MDLVAKVPRKRSFTSGVATEDGRPDPPGHRVDNAPRINIDPGKAEEGLAKLVLTVVELIRQLAEKQAIRRVESGSLSSDEIARLGTTLMQLEKKMNELKEHFGIDDLNINLGPLGNLVD
jgi:hypothetical protein